MLEIFQWWILRITVQGVTTAVVMSVRIICLIAGTSLLTYTTSPIALTDGIERLCSPLKRFKLPVHELAMMMTIALRFIPTLIEETDKIMSAQKAASRARPRNRRLSGNGHFKRFRVAAISAGGHFGGGYRLASFLWCQFGYIQSDWEPSAVPSDYGNL